MNGIETAIFDIAKALRVPVLVLALAAVALTLIELGAFLVELLRRRRRDFIRLETAATEARTALERSDEMGAKSALRPVAWSTQMARTLAFLVDQWAKPHVADRMAKGLADFDFRSVRRLDRTRLLVRAGPALGLMGTLIPLSPALSGLAKGDVQELQDNLQIAFSVTVLGLLVGAVAFGISLVRDRVYGQDLSDLEFVMSTLLPDIGPAGVSAVVASAGSTAAATGAAATGDTAPASAADAAATGGTAAAPPPDSSASAENKPPPPTNAKPLGSALPPPPSGAAAPGVPAAAEAPVPDPGLGTAPAKSPVPDPAAPPVPSAPGASSAPAAPPVPASPASQQAPAAPPVPAPVPDPAAPDGAHGTDSAPTPDPAAPDPARDATRQQAMPPSPPTPPEPDAAPSTAEPATEQLPAPPAPDRPLRDNNHPTSPEGTTSADEPW